jgi:hypothetical protein
MKVVTETHSISDMARMDKGDTLLKTFRLIFLKKYKGIFLTVQKKIMIRRRWNRNRERRQEERTGQGCKDRSKLVVLRS